MDSLAFLIIIAVGAMVQTVTGFAMGLIIMGGVALLGLVDITAAAAVVSLISLVNVSVALRRTFRFVYIRLVVAILCGMTPFIFVGVVLLDYLSTSNLDLLKMLLGVVIVVAGTLLVSKPQPYEEVSHPTTAVGFGIAAGLMGGLYAAGGAPIAYLMYRQPLMIQTIRTSLLSIFAISTIIRTGMVAVEGHITHQVLILAGMAVPVVIISTLLGDKIAPRLPDQQVRTLALALLVLIGVSLILDGLVKLLS